MRVGEAIRLDRDDVDLEHGVLTVRESKFGKSRELPLHATHRRRAARLPAAARPACARGRHADACFISTGRDAAALLQRAPRRSTGSSRAPGCSRARRACRPTLHDLRHTFAVNTLLDAYRDGVDVAAAAAAAVAPTSGMSIPAAPTGIWQAAPELLALAADRLERSQGGQR